MQSRASNLGRLEAHLELFTASQRRQHHIVEGLVSAGCICHPLKVDKGIAQGTDASGEDCSICEGAKLGKDASDRAQCGCGADVAQPDTVGGGAGPLPLPCSGSLQQPCLWLLPLKLPAYSDGVFVWILRLCTAAWPGMIQASATL